LLSCGKYNYTNNNNNNNNREYSAFNEITSRRFTGSLQRMCPEDQQKTQTFGSKNAAS
jgi:hypothetical protein